MCLLQLNQQPGLFIMRTKQPATTVCLHAPLHFKHGRIYRRGEEENVPVGSDALNKDKKKG